MQNSKADMQEEHWWKLNVRKSCAQNTTWDKIDVEFIYSMCALPLVPHCWRNKNTIGTRIIFFKKQKLYHPIKRLLNMARFATKANIIHMHQILDSRISMNRHYRTSTLKPFIYKSIVTTIYNINQHKIKQLLKIK